MSLPNHSIFKCSGRESSEADQLSVDFGHEDRIYLSMVEDGHGRTAVILSKDQVRCLRDQLTDWIGDGKACEACKGWGYIEQADSGSTCAICSGTGKEAKE